MEEDAIGSFDVDQASNAALHAIEVRVIASIDWIDGNSTSAYAEDFQIRGDCHR